MPIGRGERVTQGRRDTLTRVPGLSNARTRMSGLGLIEVGEVSPGGMYEPLEWSGREDLNLRPPPPQGGALPGCATPRLYVCVERSRMMYGRYAAVIIPENSFEGEVDFDAHRLRGARPTGELRSSNSAPGRIVAPGEIVVDGAKQGLRSEKCGLVVNRSQRCRA